MEVIEPRQKALRLMAGFHNLHFMSCKNTGSFSSKLFHRHTLGEVARHVYVQALLHGHVVGQELHGEDAEKGFETVYDVGHFEEVVGKLLDVGVALRDHGKDAAAAALHLLHVGDDFVVFSNVTKAGKSEIGDKIERII